MTLTITIITCSFYAGVDGLKTGFTKTTGYYGFNNYKVNVIKTKKETLEKIRVEKGKQSI